MKGHVGALWFLWVRQFVNGLKRSVSTPRRLISLLIGIGYYVGFFMRPWDQSSSSALQKGIGSSIQFDRTTIDQVVFIGFMMLSILLSMGLFGLRNTFRQADVDVLFATPIPARKVMLFRLFRDYAMTLLLPILISLFALMPTLAVVRAANSADPQAFRLVAASGLLAWALLSFTWVALGYALSFLVAKYEKKSKTIVRAVGWAIFFAVAAVLGHIMLNFWANPELATIGKASEAWWVRGIMILPTAATSLVMGAFTGSPLISLIGLAIFAAAIGCSLYYAANLSGWMYDQAATRGFQSQALRDLQRKNDYAGIVAERARQGKVRKSRLANRVAEWKFRKGWSLIYKEILIQSRVGYWINLIFLIGMTAFSSMFLLLPMGRNGQSFGPILYLAMTGFFSVNMSSIQSFNGFTETLRRVEVMKPLPLTSAQIAFFETASKAVVSMIMAFVPFVVGFILKPSLWEYHVAGMIAAPMTALALVAAVFLVVVLFPDFDDPTQRSFRGIMQLLALVLVLVPTVGVFALVLGLGGSPIIAAIFSAGINVGLTALLASIAGRFYADFNPNE
ncbi:MAG: hypothetical protein JST51_14000 [Armatimonadetes bacterium]|nr:hypothetical protein [Armatimonadota bacterium]